MSPPPQVTPESLVFLEVIKPAPEVLVLGCGMTSQPVPQGVHDFLAKHNIKLEVLDSVRKKSRSARASTWHASLDC